MFAKRFQTELENSCTPWQEKSLNDDLLLSAFGCFVALMTVDCAQASQLYFNVDCTLTFGAFQANKKSIVPLSILRLLLAIIDEKEKGLVSGQERASERLSNLSFSVCERPFGPRKRFPEAN